MNRAVKRRISFNKFEISIVALLLIIASFRSLYGIAGSYIALSHAATLLLCFALTRAFIGLLSETLARTFFSLTLLLLIAEILTYSFIGLHINWFVLSLLLEENSAANIGISYIRLGLLPAACIGILLWLRAQYFNKPQSLPLLKTLAFTLTAFISGQLTFGVSHFYGAPEITRVERSLPFFWSLHPYRSQKLLSPFLGRRADNPFSDSKIDRAVGAGNTNEARLKLDASAPNILFIITDSVRAHDIAKDPALVPNIMQASQDGMLSLDHYSTSNCTHFSFYTLFTGRLATMFGEARERGTSLGLMNELVAAGYNTTTAEANSLDWYDTSKLIFPPQTQRWIAEGGSDDKNPSDAAVTAQTIAQLKTWKDTQNPDVHLAYYIGSHFPYQTAPSITSGPSLSVYLETINQFDSEVGKILEALKANNLTDNTIVIITSDHGEEFIPGSRYGHGSRMNNEQIQVPLMVLGADKSAYKVRSHMDIRPFILNQLAPSEYSFSEQNTVFLTNCDYGHPKDFAVITRDGEYEFIFRDGYLRPVGETSPAQIAAANLLIDVIKNGGKPSATVLNTNDKTK